MGVLDGEVAVITGGARGQGASHARRFVAEGAAVIVADVLEQDGRSLVEELGETASFVALDVTAEGSWAAAIEAAERQFAPPTVLVNNAGVVRHASLVDEDSDNWHHVIAVNLTGVWLGIRAAAPAMRRAGHGSIINIASTAAVHGFSGVGAYVASKWGVRGITKSAALELAPDNIRVNVVLPGVVKTPMLGFDPDADGRLGDQPIPRAARPEEITNVVLLLASSDSSFMTGSEVLVDGGQILGSLPPSARTG
jgi:3alpha(or 20beta)-hydroxysteroid dehydrogenase